MSLLNRSYFFKSDHTDTLPFVSLTIILSSLILVSMFPTFVFFCLSDKTSDKRFHYSLSISSLVRNLWSSSASLQQSFTFLILKSFVHGILRLLELHHLVLVMVAQIIECLVYVHINVMYFYFFLLIFSLYQPSPSDSASFSAIFST